MVAQTCNKYHQKAYSMLKMIQMRRQGDAGIDDSGPALEQHCTNVSRRPYSQPCTLQCLRLYTSEDNICASACVGSILVNIEDARLACLPLNISMRIQCTSITFVFKFLFGNVLLINPRVSG